MYSEVERLSKAWEDVSAQASRKVFNLKETEDRLSRLATEVCLTVLFGSSDPVLI